MNNWMKIDINNIKDEEFIVKPSNSDIYYYKLHKGDIVPVTLEQAINQTDMIFNKGLFKVNKICKYDNYKTIFYLEYIKE